MDSTRRTRHDDVLALNCPKCGRPLDFRERLPAPRHLPMSPARGVRAAIRDWRRARRFASSGQQPSVGASCRSSTPCSISSASQAPSCRPSAPATTHRRGWRRVRRGTPRGATAVAPVLGRAGAGRDRRPAPARRARAKRRCPRSGPRAILAPAAAAVSTGPSRWRGDWRPSRDHRPRAWTGPSRGDTSPRRLGGYRRSPRGRPAAPRRPPRGWRSPSAARTVAPAAASSP